MLAEKGFGKGGLWERSILDLRKTSRPPDQSNTNSETVLSGGGEPIGSLTTEKLFVDGDGRSGGAGILRKSSIAQTQVKNHFLLTRRS
jgi:hypothetical protein